MFRTMAVGQNTELPLRSTLQTAGSLALTPRSTTARLVNSRENKFQIFTKV
jgi:hypothetical protein